MRLSALSWCVLASVAVHAALLAVVLPRVPRPGARNADVTRQAMVARMVLAQPAATVMPAPSVAAQPTDAMSAAALEPAAAPEASAAASAAASKPVSEAALSVSAATSWAETSEPSEAAASGDDFDGYIPRNLLTVPPVLQSTVILDSPDQPEGRYHGSFVLYIDELGVVRRVEAEGDPLPAVLTDRARQAFLGAHFEPGRLEDRIVKSRLRIAVDFERRTAASSARF